MADRPIIFSAPMVGALLAGRKTQTRRIAWRNEGDPDPQAVPHPSPWQLTKPGDRLWVREAWQDYCPLWEGAWCGHGTHEGIVRDHRPVYRADPAETWLRGPEGKEQPPTKWRPSIHMPRWASRLTLTVTDVRVQRLQEISEADARAEGHPFTWDGKQYEPPPLDSWQGYGSASFFLSVGKEFGPGAWVANPSVVAITFTVDRRNIDQEPTP